MNNLDELEKFLAYRALWRVEDLNDKGKYPQITEIEAFFKTYEDALEWRKTHSKSPSGKYTIIEESITPFFSLVVPEVLDSIDGPISEDEEDYKWGVEYDEFVEEALEKVGEYKTTKEFIENMMDDFVKLEEWKEEQTNHIEESDDDVYWPTRNTETDAFEKKVKDTFNAPILRKIKALEKNIANHEERVRAYMQKQADNPNASMVVAMNNVRAEMKKIQKKQYTLANLKKTLHQ